MVRPASKAMLRQFETAVLADPEVLGVLFTGSLGRGTSDNFSDLDIYVWLTDEAHANVTAKTRELLSCLGEIKLLFPQELWYTKALVGPNWQRVDFAARRRDELDAWPVMMGARIVKEFDGVLASVVAAAEPEDAALTLAEVREEIVAEIDSQIYLAAHNARGASWSAAGEITYRLSAVYEILARLRGRRSYGFRFVEQLLTPEEKNLIAAAWPVEPTRDEVRRAGRALWTWTRYVWGESERVLGMSLDLTIDDAELLAAVDALYEDG
jgi:predicted nucleotidyltransferase